MVENGIPGSTRERLLCSGSFLFTILWLVSKKFIACEPSLEQEAFINNQHDNETLIEKPKIELGYPFDNSTFMRPEAINKII